MACQRGVGEVELYVACAKRGDGLFWTSGSSAGRHATENTTERNAQIERLIGELFVRLLVTQPSPTAVPSRVVPWKLVCNATRICARTHHVATCDWGKTNSRRH